MRLFRHVDEISEVSQGAVVALGNFDGFHRGHQVVLGEAGRLARTWGVPLAVVVTEPHPVHYFAPDNAPFRLTPFRERALLLERFGVDALLVLPFDKELASTSAEDFIQNVLVGGFNAHHLVVGYDYRFGRGRAGDVELLAGQGQEHAFGLAVIDPVTVGIDGFAGEVYSSTLVRQALKEGKPRRAAALLGHWWTISGRVVHGEKRGRQIGFPTLNLELGERLEPNHGVYAVRVSLADRGEVIDGVANLGARPTFDKSDVLLEVYLLDFEGDLYDCHIDVELVCAIRDVQKFSGLEALKEQIEKDVETARTVLGDPENARERLLLPRLADYLALYPEQHPCTQHVVGPLKAQCAG